MTELFCFLVRTIFAAFEVHFLLLLRKMKKSNYFVLFHQIFRLQVTCMTNLIRKTLKLLNLTWNYFFMKIRQTTFCVKLLRGLVFVWKLTQDKQMWNLKPLSGKSVFCGVKAHSTLHISGVCSDIWIADETKSTHTINCALIQNKQLAWIWPQTDRSFWTSGSLKYSWFWLKFRITLLNHLMHWFMFTWQPYHRT